MLGAPGGRHASNPPPPGQLTETLCKDFLKLLKMKQAAPAKKTSASALTARLLVNGKRAVTAHTAGALSSVLGTTPDFWMNLQATRDVWFALRDHKRLKTSSRRAAT